MVDQGGVLIGGSNELEARVRLLSPRHKDCLRLAYHRKVTKEIAAELGLAVGTVSTYCTEAIRLLGARDRRQAAELLHEWELAHSGSAPFEREPPSEGVVTTPLRPADPEPADPMWVRLLPLRSKDAPGNDLPVFARLFWILLLAGIVAVGFGAVANAVHVINDIARHS